MTKKRDIIDNSISDHLPKLVQDVEMETKQIYSIIDTYNEIIRKIKKSALKELKTFSVYINKTPQKRIRCINGINTDILIKRAKLIKISKEFKQLANKCRVCISSLPGNRHGEGDRDVRPSRPGRRRGAG